MRPSTAPDLGPSWIDFVLALLASGVLVLGFLTLLVSLLAAAALVAALLVVVLVRRKAHPRALLGLVSGAALPLLAVAWLNRGGPGERCTPHSCEDLMNPWPWAAIGAVLVLAGLVPFAWTAQQSKTRQRVRVID